MSLPGHLVLFALTFQVSDRPSVSATVNAFLVAATFAIYPLVYSMREPAKVHASRVREILLPIFCAVLPVLIFETGRWKLPPALAGSDAFRFLMQNEAGIPLSIWFMLLGNGLVVWGLFYLRRSFSVFTEVRSLVTAGPYRYIRHPLYVGQSLATVGVCLASPSPAKIALTTVFLIAQRLRASLEEAKIASVVPEYRDYRERTGAYFPKRS